MSNQPIVVPLNLRDSDFDGVSDYDERYVLGTNPYAVDTDRDGIPDGVDLNPRVNQVLISDVAQQLGPGQGEHYTIVIDGPLLQVSALDGRSGLDGQGMIFYQHGRPDVIGTPPRRFKSICSSASPIIDGPIDSDRPGLTTYSPN